MCKCSLVQISFLGHEISLSVASCWRQTNNEMSSWCHLLLPWTFKPSGKGSSPSMLHWTPNSIRPRAFLEETSLKISQTGSKLPQLDQEIQPFLSFGVHIQAQNMDGCAVQDSTSKKLGKEYLSTSPLCHPAWAKATCETLYTVSSALPLRNPLQSTWSSFL